LDQTFLVIPLFIIIILSKELLLYIYTYCFFLAYTYQKYEHKKERD